MRTIRSSLICLAVALCLAVTLPSRPVAAESGQHPSAAGASSLRIGFLEPVESLNPFRFINDNDPSHLLTGLLYDYLFSLDQDGNYSGNLATAASCADARCQNWTYTIRQDVVWSDGTTFTAADVSFTINYNTQNFFQLWAFEPYVNRILQCTTANRPYCGALQTGPSEVTVYFDQPFAPGKSLFVPILEKAQWEGISPQQAQYTFENPNPIGTGPFVADPNIYSEWVNGQPLHLLRNARYHPVGNHTGASGLDDVYLVHFADTNSMAVALENDEIDLAFMTASSIGQLHGQPNIETQEALFATRYFNQIGFTQIASQRLNPARDDIAVRQALAMATNKDYIVQNLYGGKGLRGADLISPLAPDWSYDPVADGTNLTFDLGAANALLNISGYTTWIADPTGICQSGVRSATSTRTVIANDNVDSNDTITIPAGQRLAFTMAIRQEFPAEQDTASYVQAAWCQVGVSVQLKIEREAALADDVYLGGVEMYIWDWSGDPDPNYLLSIESAYTLDGWNDNYWNNGTYNSLYRAQLAAVNLTTRHDFVRAAQRTHYTSAVYIVYIYPYGEWAYRTDALVGWGNWSAHPYRQPNALWGGNPLFLDLHLYVPTVAVALSGAEGRPGLPVTVTGGVNATLAGVWTLDWGDGNTSNGTFPPGRTNLSESHTYGTEGAYAVLLTAQTSFDTVRATSRITVDGTPPITRASLSGTQAVPPWYRPPVTTALSASDDGTGVATTSYRIDNGTWRTYTTPFQITVDGWHTVEYKSTDRVGNEEATRSASFGIDTQNPIVSSSVTGTSGLNGWYTSAVSVALSAADATSGVALLSYQVDGGAWNEYRTPVVLADGVYVFRYQAIDAAGNLAPVRSMDLWVDTLPPETVETELGASGSAGWYVSNVTVGLNALDATSGAARISYSLDGGPWVDYGQALLLLDGIHTVSYRAEDVAGNLEATQSSTVKVDTRPPNLRIDALPAAVTSSELVVSWSAVDTVSGVAAYFVSVDDGAFQAMGTTTRSSLRLSDGRHVIAVRAVDAAGNSAIQEVKVSIDANVFSPSGPYAGIPTYAILGAAASLAAFVLRRRSKARSRRPGP